MPIDYCKSCSNPYSWEWEEAFDKFGFNDGDGQIMTGVIEDLLTQAGYKVNSSQWGLHNVIMNSIKLNSIELMPVDDDFIHIGYDNPRDYLPSEIIDILDGDLDV
jgi:hypothetical protein